ncbi:predicted protein [Lodderomyces elongisporus NRRL YB-4239]|uniref:Uncharacterized protein n=1 Tax=Lodderomyces elongisporus (strain ATCC 11503 / CBS 2605 / JCM 1781 / NBRC 1676 / NRRL YB-4239) TaxID=379508 RepID=A5E5H8_LODEL|nr:predicted protein [Lodderomyces elongisporus NRRL YB-4239]
MVKGYEETCEYINEIRRRFIDDSKVEEIPYIMYPNSAVEKTFMAYYNALTANLNRTPSDELALKRYNVRKFPPMKVKDIDGFYYWLRSMVWYKHTYFIPDYLIRDTIIATAKEVDDPALTGTVQTSCKKIDKALYSPIKYNLLFKDWRKSNNGERPTDIIREVDEIFKSNIHPKSVMVNVQGEIENYLESNHVNALPVMTWIRIFKMLFGRLSVVMDQIIYYMSPDIKVVKVNEKGLNYEITLNGFEIRHHLYSLKMGSLKQLLDVEGEVPYNDIWDAVSTTYDDNMSRIHVVGLTLKMKQTKGDLCQVCIKIGHELTKCYRAKEAEKCGTILMKNRRVFTPDGTELMISEKETMMRKYPDLFTSAEGRHLYK